MRIGRPLPRSDARYRVVGEGYPIWVLCAQYIVVCFSCSSTPTRSRASTHSSGLRSAGDGDRGHGPVHATAARPPDPCERLGGPPPGLVDLVHVLDDVRLSQWLHATMAEFASIVGLTLVASALPMHRLRRVLLGSLYTMVVYSYTYTVLVPGATTTYDEATGAVANVGWHGPFNHKNNLASFMVVGMLMVLTLETDVRRRHTVTAMALLVVLSRSGTGNGSMFAAVRDVLAVASVRAAIGTSWWSVAHRIALGVDRRHRRGIGVPPLTSPPLWQGPHAHRTDRHLERRLAGGPRPTVDWLRLGRRVGRPITAAPSLSILRRLGFVVFHSHNGALELLLELGFGGLVLFLCVFCTTTVGGGWKLLRVQPLIGCMVVAFCMFVFISSVTEVLVTGPWLVLLVFMRTLHFRLLAEADEGDDQPAASRFGGEQRVGRPGDRVERQPPRVAMSTSE